MDWQYLFNMVAGVGMLGVGWWCRQIWDSVQQLKKDVQKIEVALPTDYVRKVDLESRFDKLDITLQRILDKLDQKVDRE